MTGRLIAVVGPSGVGKDSVMQGLVTADQRLSLARRVITRPSSQGGECFDAVSLADFHARRIAGAFSLQWSAHDLHYAIPASTLREVRAGRDVLANLSRSVLRDAQDRFTHLEVVSLSANPAVLAQRLTGRGREGAEQIAKRLERKAPDLPDNLTIHRVANDGALDDTVRTIRAMLYPADAI